MHTQAIHFRRSHLHANRTLQLAYCIWTVKGEGKDCKIKTNVFAVSQRYLHHEIIHLFLECMSFRR
uniref:Uncharacterized protein n=1 Tax=Anguilla anguilla TaxID=7936 RepID=A0A0E9U0H3_ANGAN